MPLTPSTRAALAAYWADFFGVAPGRLTTPGVAILPHAELDAYHGIFCFRHGATTLVSVPPDRLAHWQAQLADRPADTLLNPVVLGQHLGAAPQQVIGPAVIAYADAATLRPLPDTGARLLTTADTAAYAALQGACEPEAWAHGGSDFGLLPLAGCFVRGTLVALAGYEVWGTQIAHLAVITHPAHRGRGHGGAAASCLAEAVVARGMILQYRTLRANGAALRIGAALGGEPFAETLAVRLGR